METKLNDDIMENQLTVLPAELAPLAAGVASEKSAQVMGVLGNVFSGVEKMRAALDAVTVQDEHDKAGMASAKQIRLEVKRTRVDAEKQFDTKRCEVQALMASYKTEDTLWLKAKQIMQATCKEIEQMAVWKEATAERLAAERLELRTMERTRKVVVFSQEIHVSEYADMSDTAFEAFFVGVKKAAAEKAEEEAAAKAEAEAESAKAKAEADKLKAENERLEKEAAKAAKAAKESEAKIRAEAEAEKAKAEAEAEKLKAEAEKLKAEAEKLKAEAEAKAKAEAEAFKAEADRLEALKQAGDSAKLKNLAANLAAFMKQPENALTLESDASKAKLETAVKRLREAYKILSA